MSKSKSKRFDCVRMKWEIQERLQAEFARLPPDEAARLARARIEADPILAPFLEKVRNAPSPRRGLPR